MHFGDFYMSMQVVRRGHQNTLGLHPKKCLLSLGQMEDLVIGASL